MTWAASNKVNYLAHAQPGMYAGGYTLHGLTQVKSLEGVLGYHEEHSMSGLEDIPAKISAVPLAMMSISQQMYEASRPFAPLLFPLAGILIISKAMKNLDNFGSK